MIGDCQCIVGGELHANGKPRESLIAKKRAEAFNAMASAHADMIDHGELVHDYARDSVLAELVESMAEENKTYAVIDGYPIYRDGIRLSRWTWLKAMEPRLARSPLPTSCSPPTVTPSFAPRWRRARGN